MSNTTETRMTTRELKIMQDIFIFLLLDASVPQQTVTKIVRLKLKRVNREILVSETARKTVGV